MDSPPSLPKDTHEGQGKRAADYMAAHPACTYPELGIGADLGSATKIVSQMVRKFGYCILRERKRVPTRAGTHSRDVVRLTLVSRPTHSQQDLFPTE